MQHITIPNLIKLLHRKLLVDSPSAKGQQGTCTLKHECNNQIGAQQNYEH